jgi:transposase-like protein
VAVAPVAQRAEPAGYVTIMEIARHLGRPESTVRHWRNAYRDLLDEQSGPDGSRRYALAVFMEIERLHRAGRSGWDVRAALAGGADAVPSESWHHDLIAAIRELTVAVNRLADRLPPERP